MAKKNKIFLTKDEKKSIKLLYKQKRNKFFTEFVAFINRGNVLNLAVGIIVGAAFTAIVTALTQGILMPLVGYLIGDFDLSQIKQVLVEAVVDEQGGVIKPEVALLWGNFLQKILDFVLMAFFIFLLVKVVAAVTNKMALVKAAIIKKEAEAKEQEEAKAEGNPTEEAKQPVETVQEEELSNTDDAIKPESEVELLKEIRDYLKGISKN